MNRFVLRFALGTAAAALLLDTAVWALACGRLDDGARDAAQAAGWVLEGGPARWGGWPVAAQVTLADAGLRAGPGIVPPLHWTVPRLTLRLPAWAPTTLTLGAEGVQQIAVGAAAPIRFTATDLRARINLLDRAPPRVDAAGLDAAGPTGPVRIGMAAVTLYPDGWSAELGGVTFPGRDGRPITPAIESVRLSGRIHPPIEVRPSATESAQAWRAAGGRLVLEVAGLRWGALTGGARAEVGLDPALQPEFDGTLTASGLSAALGQLADSGAVTAASSGAAQAMLAILAAPIGAGMLTLPVSLHGGVLSVARFPLLRLLPVVWD